MESAAMSGDPGPTDSTSPRGPWLVVNADDFGLNDSATGGIADAFDAGAVTSTTLMVNAPAVDAAVRVAQARPALGVGLHFNLTWGRPVAGPAQVPSLVDRSGRFHDRRALGRRLLAGAVPAHEIACELAAQRAAFAALGLVPTHIDSHQHVHAFPRVFAAVAAECRRAGLWMRVPWVGPGRTRDPARWLRRRLLRGLLRRASAPWHGRVRWNDSLGSVFDLGTVDGALDDGHYGTVLAGLHGDVRELMVHPVRDAAQMRGFTAIGPLAEAEWRYLASGSLPALARRLGLAPTHYGRLGAAAAAAAPAEVA
jgi:chitin disaccharide deacetylase